MATRSAQFAESVARHCAKEPAPPVEVAVDGKMAVNLRFRVNGCDVPAEQFAEAVARTKGEGSFRHEILVADDLHEPTTPEDEAKAREWYQTIIPRAGGGTAHHEYDVAAYIVGDMVAEEREASPAHLGSGEWICGIFEDGPEGNNPWARYAMQLLQALRNAKAADASFYKCPGERESTVWGHIERALALPMPGADDAAMVLDIGCECNKAGRPHKTGCPMPVDEIEETKGRG
jgi:hypothetical protein